MTRHVDKVILVNNGAMTTKYGTTGRRRIDEALNAMVVADADREISTRIVALDHGPTMTRLGGEPIGSPDDAHATKAAVDVVAQATTSHYILLLGAPDLISQQDLLNPTGDDDPSVPSDLPYACIRTAGADPGDFVGVTRVVGRLPDLLGETNPAALIRTVKAASQWRSRPPADYSSVFALSTETWKQSTELSVQQLGCIGPVRVSPPGGPRWTERQISARVHFVNCHGADTDASWYGERENLIELPVALRSPWLSGHISKGTVVAAECCYGAQHYLPSSEAHGAPGMAVSYLRAGAIGVLGSSTISYGPADEMGSADLLTRYFLSAVLEGASLGRALLTARQRFVQELGEIDPIDLKTLAQFDLQGDPSVHVVRKAGAGRAPKNRSLGFAVNRASTAMRRVAFDRVGLALDEAIPRVSASPLRSQRGRVETLAGTLGRSLEVNDVIRSYRMSEDVTPEARSNTRFHLIGTGNTVEVIRDQPGQAPTLRTVLRK
jgi:Peptidase family C25